MRILITNDDGIAITESRRGLDPGLRRSDGMGEATVIPTFDVTPAQAGVQTAW